MSKITLSAYSSHNSLHARELVDLGRKSQINWGKQTKLKSPNVTIVNCLWKVVPAFLDTSIYPEITVQQSLKPQ